MMFREKDLVKVEVHSAILICEAHNILLLSQIDAPQGKTNEDIDVVGVYIRIVVRKDSRTD